MLIIGRDTILDGRACRCHIGVEIFGSVARGSPAVCLLGSWMRTFTWSTSTVMTTTVRRCGIAAHPDGARTKTHMGQLGDVDRAVWDRNRSQEHGVQLAQPVAWSFAATVHRVHA